MISDSLGFILLIFALSALLAIWFSKNRTNSANRNKTRFADGLRAIVVGDRMRAMRILRETAIEDTSNAEAFILLGDLVREEIGPRKALQIHHSVADRKTLTPAESFRVSKSLALDYSKIGDHEMAADILARALKSNQDNWTKELLIEEYEKLGRWPEAFDLLSSFKNAALQHKGQLALYKVMMGNSAAENEKYHNARILFKDAIRIDEECPSAYLRIGDAYYAEGRIADAIEWWKKFCAKFPKIAWTSFERLERAAYDLSDFGSMITFYSKFISANTEDFRAREALSDLFVRMGRLDDAITTLQGEFEAPIELEIKLLALIQKRDNIAGEIGELIGTICLRACGKYKYTCSSCGTKINDPMWYCFECGAWNSFGI